MLGVLGAVLYKKCRRKKTTPVTDEPLDPVIARILDEQDLANQLRINAWRMAKAHKYLKKHPDRKALMHRMEKNVALMEKVNQQIKRSPKRDMIYRKRGKPVPTFKADFNTVLKEPQKVKHISSVAKLKIRMLPMEYEQRRKRKNFKRLKQSLLPAELTTLKQKKLVTNSVFKKNINTKSHS